ncbi:hypothetical protein Taro_011899 [Colocasia esculenta]|uniref:AB hydrolase-1 domain-containing protein n=1 Tax=Colocasia esculenta TaxID=4460 RepID=A0A843UC01_COLES|nr:hypothetical protein [Colocasia esculenta]
MDAAAMEVGTRAASSAASLLLELAAEVPASYYYLGTLLVFFVFVYNLLEFHVVGDVLRGCRGDRATLTFNPASELCQHVVSRCRVLRSRYLVTPWIASPHLQTAFAHFFGNPPTFTYRRSQVFPVSDEEAVALDWLLSSDVAGHQYPPDTNKTISKDDTVPIVVVVPGLTGDSACPYVRHLVYKIAKRGWNVVVSNHRGLGGIPIKSECYYNAGLTDDIRKVIKHLHQEYPKAPLFAVGTSMGANLLVKYLGEEGESTPLAGAASVCSPWDLLMCDRFLNRGPVQKFYDRALAIALKDYAQLNQNAYSKLVDWEGVRMSNSMRDFHNNTTCLILNYETADTYYRRSSSVHVVSNVSVPLLCVSALDDPVCTKEAIPWDECRANKNILLATTAHGGHLAFLQGLTASGSWWVEAVDEFLGVLHSSPFMRGEKEMQPTGLDSPRESSLEKSPRGSVTDHDVNMMVMVNGGANLDSNKYPNNDQAAVVQNVDYSLAGTEWQDEEKEASKEVVQENPKSSAQESGSENCVGNLHSKIFPENKSRNQILRRNTKSIWMLAYIAAVTTWPLVGPVFLMAFKRKFKNVLPAALLRR